MLMGLNKTPFVIKPIYQLRDEPRRQTPHRTWAVEALANVTQVAHSGGDEVKMEAEQPWPEFPQGT